MKGEARVISVAFGVSMAKKQPLCSASPADFHRSQTQRNVLNIFFRSEPCVGALALLDSRAFVCRYWLVKSMNGPRVM